MHPPDDSATLRRLIDAKAEATPEAVFLVDPETGNSLSFHGLRQQSLVLFNLLRQEGLESGDKVAFLMDNGLFTAGLFLGSMYSGFVAVPLNVRAGVVQLSYMLEHCDARVVYVEEQYQALFLEARGKVGRELKMIPAEADGGFAAPETALTPAIPDPRDAALLMYSSGSTGQPKAAMHTHSSVLAHGRNSVCSYQLTSTDRSLLVLPLYHINAECVTLVPTLLSGGSVVVPRRFSVPHFWDWIDDYRCTWSALVPTIVSELVDWDDPLADRRHAAFERIRFLRSSSAPLSPSLHRQFLDKFKLPLLQAMGSTEAGNYFSNPIPPSENKIGSPGLVWGFEAKVVDRQGEEVLAGEPGEVLLRGPALMAGYYKEPDATSAVVDSDGWLHTGDLVNRDSDGYFFVVGRLKELVIKGGVNIAPRQIDDVLESHPSVLEAAALGIPDRYFGEDLIAFVVLRAGYDTTETELLSFCESRLGHFKTPTRIHFVQDLPKGPSGKVQRLRLLDEEVPLLAATRSREGSGASQARTSSVEQVVASVWEELLEVSQVDPDSNFFALGGHSLLAIQCLSRLREKLPVVLSLSDFFEHSTVAGQAELIRQRLQRDGDADDRTRKDSTPDWERTLVRGFSPGVQQPIPRRHERLACPMSPGQERLWFDELLSPGVPVYNESEAVRLQGELDVDALERALNAIVARHEVLRSTIEKTIGLPRVVVHQSCLFRIKAIDLSGLAPAERESEVERLLVAEPQVPFLLEKESAIRATLVRLGALDHVFILMMHHNVCDWASEGILWRELSVLYRSTKRGESATLPELPIQYGDFAAWRQQEIAESDFAGELTFWEKNLRGAPPLLDLPSDRPRPATMSRRGGRLRWKVNRDTTAALRNTSHRENTSLFIVFAAALNNLLYRYTGSDDILLGIPLSNRDKPELQNLIGFLLHVHVLRTRLSGDITFRELLARVQKGVLDLYASRSIPFDQIIRKVRPERDPGFSPLFQVMFVWRDREQQLSFIGIDGLAVESLLAESKTSKFDLTVFATDLGDEIWLEMEYSSDLFDEARIQGMLTHYETLLEAAAADPGQRVSELPLLTAAERERILVDQNRTQRGYPREQRVHELIEEQIERTPYAVAIVFEDHQLTYRDLSDRANLLAEYLQTLGVGPNTLVGVFMERSHDVVVTLLGILKTGAAYLPLDPAYPSDRLAFMLADARPLVVLTRSSLGTLLPPGPSQVVCIDSLPANVVEGKQGWTAPARRTAGDLAYVLYTSGSTGAPKGVQIPHRALINFLCSMRVEPGITAHDTLLAVTTLSFDIAGLELFLPLTTGARVVIASGETVRDGRQLSALLDRSGATIMQATPATWRLLLDSGWAGSPALKILCGGEPWPIELANELLPRCKSLWNMYGPTETTIWSSAAAVEKGRPILIGRPIANTVFYVLDTNGQAVPPGVPGELYIGGDGIAFGYLRRPDLTTERFVRDPFSREPSARLYRTGDLVCRLADGGINFVRRLDDQVKIRGHRIELGEIEASLKRHPHVSQCVVVVEGDDSVNKRLVAYIVPADRHPAPNAPVLRELLQTQLPDYMIPAAFVPVAKLPLTPNGKIDRKALSRTAPLSAPAAPTQDDGRPRTPLELHLKQAWEKVLGIPSIGIRDNFFHLGGHSLLALRLIGEINRSLDTSFPVPAFAQNPTIEGMATIFKRDSYARGEPKLVPLKPGHSAGEIFFIGAGLAECRIAEYLDAGPASFATWAPLSSKVSSAAAASNGDLPPMEEIAAPHASLILKHQPSGPCFLAGYSFHGLVAFEVAHQLRQQGRDVEIVMLVDSWAMNPVWWQKLAALPLSRTVASLKSRTRRMIGRQERKTVPPGSFGLGHELDSPAKDSFPEINDMPWEVLRRISSHVLKRYRFRSLESHAVLFRTLDDARSPYLAIDQTMGWNGQFTRGLEIVDLPGRHQTILEEPYIGVFARQFGDHLPAIPAAPPWDGVRDPTALGAAK